MTQLLQSQLSIVAQMKQDHFKIDSTLIENFIVATKKNLELVL